jgi:hypothetical protein
MWARIENNVVVELTDINPEGRFHKDLVWKSCNSSVQVGWIYEGNEFVSPSPVEEPTVENEITS